MFFEQLLQLLHHPIVCLGTVHVGGDPGGREQDSRARCSGKLSKVQPTQHPKHVRQARHAGMGACKHGSMQVRSDGDSKGVKGCARL